MFRLKRQHCLQPVWTRQSTMWRVYIQAQTCVSSDLRRDTEYYRGQTLWHSACRSKLLPMQPSDVALVSIRRSYMSVKFAKCLSTFCLSTFWVRRGHWVEVVRTLRTNVLLTHAW